MCWPSGTPAASCRLRSTGSVWSSFVEQAGWVLPPVRPRHRAWRHAMQSATAAVLAGADVAARAVDVWKVYGSSDATRVDALAGVTVDFRRRGFTAIMGPSGSGKSTLLHCLAGLDLVSSGQVWLGDTQVDTLGDRGLTRLRRERVGFVFQMFNLLPTLTAEENITLPLAIGGRKPDRAWLELVITTVGLGDRLEHRPAQLSGGDLRRRAHRQPRLPLGRRGARVPAALGAGARPDRRDGDPRPDRGCLCRPGGVPGRRPHRRRAGRPDRRAGAGAHEAPRHQPEERVMLRATLKGLLARKLRLLLSGLAVVFGVMAVSGALVLTDNLGRSFDALFQTVNQNLDVQVRGAQHVDAGQRGGRGVTEPIPAEVVGKVAAVPGVQNAIGAVLEDGARVVGQDGKAIGSSGPPRFGVGWRGEVGFVELRAGRGPRAPGEVAISAGLAKQGNFKLGDQLGVLTLQPKRTFTLVGIFGYTGGRDSLGAETRVAFTEPVAQRLMLGKPGTYSVVNVLAQQGVSTARLRDAIQAVLGGGYSVRTRQQVADDQASDVTAFLGFLRGFLLGFAGVTLFVGVFLILNTFSILVAQRTRELALLRSLGASRSQVLRSVLVEAVLVGLLAATLGLFAGLGVAALLRAVMQAARGVSLPNAGLTLPVAAIVASYLVGVLVTMVAALLPALRASRVPPVAAMRDAATPDKPLTALTIAGALPALAGVGAVGAALFGDLGDATPPALLGGVLLTFIGVAMLTPAISRPAVAVLGRAFAWSTPGRLGQRNSARNPRRTAITAAALMVGIALVTGVSVLASSLKASLGQLVRQDLAAELVISGDNVTNRSTPSYDPAVIDKAKQLEGERGRAAHAAPGRAGHRRRVRQGPPPCRRQHAAAGDPAPRPTALHRGRRLRAVAAGAGGAAAVGP